MSNSQSAEIFLQEFVTVDLGEGAGPKQVTRKLHGTLSGREQVIVLHLPLAGRAA